MPQAKLVPQALAPLDHREPPELEQQVPQVQQAIKVPPASTARLVPLAYKAMRAQPVQPATQAPLDYQAALDHKDRKDHRVI